MSIVNMCWNFHYFPLVCFDYLTAYDLRILLITLKFFRTELKNDLEELIVKKIRKISNKISSNMIISSRINALYNLTINLCEKCNKKTPYTHIISFTNFGISFCNKCIKKRMIKYSSLPVYGVFWNNIPDDFPRLKILNEPFSLAGKNIDDFWIIKDSCTLIDKKITVEGLSKATTVKYKRSHLKRKRQDFFKLARSIKYDNYGIHCQ